MELRISKQSGCILDVNPARSSRKLLLYMYYYGRFYETVQLEATKEAEQRDQVLMHGQRQSTPLSPANSREADTAAV